MRRGPGKHNCVALLSLAFYVGSSWLAVIVASPFSRLARDPFEYDAVDNDVSIVL
jgi:hypothetical protein